MWPQPIQAIPFCIDVSLFCGDVGLFCRDIGLFSGEMCLFCGDIRNICKSIPRMSHPIVFQPVYLACIEDQVLDSAPCIKSHCTCPDIFANMTLVPPGLCLPSRQTHSVGDCLQRWAQEKKVKCVRVCAMTLFFKDAKTNTTIILSAQQSSLHSGRPSFLLGNTTVCRQRCRVKHWTLFYQLSRFHRPLTSPPLVRISSSGENLFQNLLLLDFLILL